MLKEISHELARLFLSSLSGDIALGHCRFAYVTSIHMNGEMFDPAIYRMVSHVSHVWHRCVTCKLIEKDIVMQYLEDHHILRTNNMAFTKDCICDTIASVCLGIVTQHGEWKAER